jgi:hypothetical protein
MNGTEYAVAALTRAELRESRRVLAALSNFDEHEPEVWTRLQVIFVALARIAHAAIRRANPATAPAIEKLCEVLDPRTLLQLTMDAGKNCEDAAGR